MSKKLAAKKISKKNTKKFQKNFFFNLDFSVCCEAQRTFLGVPKYPKITQNQFKNLC